MQHRNYRVLRWALPGLALAFFVAASAALPGAGTAATSATASTASTGEAAPPVPRQKLVRGHWSEKPEIMRKNHQALLREGMNVAASRTRRQEDKTIERCVTCHIVRDERWQPVSAVDARHFCRQCHSKENVSIQCFRCHASLPASDPAVMSPEVKNNAAVKARLEQWQQHVQGGAQQ